MEWGLLLCNSQIAGELSQLQWPRKTSIVSWKYYLRSNYRPQSADLKSALDNAIGKHSVTVVADIVGGANWKNLIDLLAQGGRYTCAGAIAGPIVEMDLRTLYLHDLTFTGCTVVAPDTFGKLVSYIERGEVSPVLAATYPLAKLQEAQAQFIRKQHIGNIVVTMD